MICLDGEDTEIATLLEGDAVDLAGISQAIRAQPELKQLVLAMSESLALIPGMTPGNVEEAAVVLGKNRLRVLVKAWSSIRNHGAEHSPVAPLALKSFSDGGRMVPPERAGAGQPSSDWGIEPEILYLTSFFHWLGLDEESNESADPANRSRAMDNGASQGAGLADLLLRDLASLTPYLEPVPETAPSTTSALEFATAFKEGAE